MKLYVGNLSFNTTADDLTELFSGVGTVQSANVIEDRETGRSRGFGFVEMSSKEEGSNAIDQFNGKEVDGRQLKVNEAKPQESRGAVGGGRGGFGGNRGGGPEVDPAFRCFPAAPVHRQANEEERKRGPGAVIQIIVHHAVDKSDGQGKQHSPLDRAGLPLPCDFA